MGKAAHHSELIQLLLYRTIRKIENRQPEQRVFDVTHSMLTGNTRHRWSHLGHVDHLFGDADVPLVVLSDLGHYQTGVLAADAPPPAAGQVDRRSGHREARSGRGRDQSLRFPAGGTSLSDSRSVRRQASRLGHAHYMQYAALTKGPVFRSTGEGHWAPIRGVVNLVCGVAGLEAVAAPPAAKTSHTRQKETSYKLQH